MQYDFTLIAGQSQVLEVRGSYFKYKGGLGAIRVTPSSGGPVDLLPGQGMSGIAFERLTIKDLTGNANMGFVLAGDGKWDDDRITGTVEVLEGGKARTLAGMAFCATVETGAVDAAMLGRAAIFNPVDSVKRIVVEAIGLSSPYAQKCNMFAMSAMLATDAGPGASKDFISAKTSVARLSTGQVSIPGPGPAARWQLSVIANGRDVWTPKEPIVLAPGSGIVLWSQTQGVYFAASFEWFEESIGV
jgi:hypothetical protein